MKLLIQYDPQDLQAHQYQYYRFGLMGPLFSFFPLGLSCFVVCVMWCVVMRCGVLGLDGALEGMHFSQSKMHFYLIKLATSIILFTALIDISFVLSFQLDLYNYFESSLICQFTILRSGIRSRDGKENSNDNGNKFQQHDNQIFND